MQDLLQHYSTLEHPQGHPPGHRHPPESSIRRRLSLFFIAFLAASALSLSYTYLRPAVYQSKASLLITSRSPEEQTNGTPDVSTVAVQRHVISHPSVISKVWERFVDSVDDKESIPFDSSQLDSMLTATAIPETNILELRAEGARPKDLTALVTLWIDIYRNEQASSEKASSQSASAAIRQQLGELEGRVKAQREELARFRDKHDIASMQREENRVLARLNGLTDSLTKSEEAEVAARARVEALKEAIDGGHEFTLEEDQETLVRLEERIMQLRGLLQGREQTYSSDFLARDKVHAELREQLAALEEGFEIERAELVRLGLSQAELDLSTAEKTTAMISEQLAEHKQIAANFTTRFAEHEALVEDLTQLEELYRKLQERIVQSEVMREALPPEVSVVKEASIPQSPIRPAYRRDAAISLAGSLLFGLAAVLIDVLASRPVRQASLPETRTVFYPVAEAQAIAQSASREVLEAPKQRALERQRRPRELSAAEVAALLRASRPATQGLIAGLFIGLSVDEARSLRWEQVNLKARTIEVRGSAPRTLSIPPPMADALSERGAATADPATYVWPNAQGESLSASAIDTMTVSDARAAGFDRSGEADAASLRHTYVAFLVRQGVSLSELPEIVGQLSEDELADYRFLSPPGDSVALKEIDCEYPALGAVQAGSTTSR